MVIIKDFKDKYAEALFKIHKDNLPHIYQMSKESFFDEFTCDTRKYFVALDRGIVKGYLGLSDFKDSDMSIMGIVVDRKSEGQGIGTRLIKRAIDFAKGKDKKFLSLEVDIENKRAVRFYKNLGFTVTRVRKKYYMDNDAYVMFLKL